MSFQAKSGGRKRGAFDDGRSEVMTIYNGATAADDMKSMKSRKSRK